MAEDLEKNIEDYQKSLEDKMEKGMHVPKSKFGRVLTGLSICALTVITSLTAINYNKHSGSQEFINPHQTKGVAKVTGMISFVEYRNFEDISITDFNIKNSDVDVLIKGNLFGKSEAYLDTESDGKVDWIHYYGRKSNLYREKDYDQNKKLFDNADEELVKYKLKFSK